ncbi:G-type lectin S-receptor-like serine/threonine-protein kinase SD2-5 [Hordeum vulgare]|nr:G-type lectin S-receptor-like serine/threonine-protein kinase SD2-5 [Hordeum vulgare]
MTRGTAYFTVFHVILAPRVSGDPPSARVDKALYRFVLVVFVVIAVLSILGSVAIAYFVYRCVRKSGLPTININTTPVPAVAAEPGSTTLYAVVPDSQIPDATAERFLKEIAGEKPIRFTPRQLSGFTNSYSSRLGAVYKGMLPNGLTVAVKLLHPGHDDRTSQEQFMAEVGTIGRTHHINLIRLFGFCYDADVRALVYEYMEHGALDSYLFDGSRRDVGF